MEDRRSDYEILVFEKSRVAHRTLITAVDIKADDDKLTGANRQLNMKTFVGETLPDEFLRWRDIFRFLGKWISQTAVRNREIGVHHKLPVDVLGVLRHTKPRIPE